MHRRGLCLSRCYRDDLALQIHTRLEEAEIIRKAPLLNDGPGDVVDYIETRTFVMASGTAGNLWPVMHLDESYQVLWART